jgi:hypothetical protein
VKLRFVFRFYESVRTPLLAATTSFRGTSFWPRENEDESCCTACISSATKATRLSTHANSLEGKAAEREGQDCLLIPPDRSLVYDFPPETEKRQGESTFRSGLLLRPSLTAQERV